MSETEAPRPDQPSRVTDLLVALGWLIAAWAALAPSVRAWIDGDQVVVRAEPAVVGGEGLVVDRTVGVLAAADGFLDHLLFLAPPVLLLVLTAVGAVVVTGALRRLRTNEPVAGRLWALTWLTALGSLAHAALQWLVVRVGFDDALATPFAWPPAWVAVVAVVLAGTAVALRPRPVEGDAEV